MLTSWAFEMENLILAWYILVETKDVRLLALYGALLYVGTLVAPLFGVVGDRIGHRRVLTAMRVTYALLAAALAALAFAGLLEPVLVLVIVAGVGMIRPSDIGVRSALLSGVVPPTQLTAAMSLARMTIESARITGALSGAALVAYVGIANAYVVVTLFYVVGAILTLSLHAGGPRALPEGMTAATRPSPLRDLKEGLVYVWRTPHLLAGMWIAFIANFAAYPMSNGLLPYVAREIYHIDQTGLSYLVAGFAGGGLIGSLILGVMGGAARAGRLTLLFGTLWYVMLLAFARMPTPQTGFIMLMCAGICQTLSLVSLSVYLMRTADERFRGRVMGVRMLAIYGLPVGLMLAGELIAMIGFVETATLYCIVGMASMALVGAIWWKHLWSATAPANAR